MSPIASKVLRLAAACAICVAVVAGIVLLIRRIF
jgi:hypothetical protein